MLLKQNKTKQTKKEHPKPDLGNEERLMKSKLITDKHPINICPLTGYCGL